MKLSRQEANLQIAKILQEQDSKVLRFAGEELEDLAQVYPQQRAGQLLTNYVFVDYRNPKVSAPTQELLEYLFPINFDPFYEESTETLERLKKQVAE